ncbi:putative antitoxin [Cannes 8 virus]|nr:putative antitoxin [Cannes 8 virus]AVR52810.1 putative antitoxin [Marseillevirus Shanghai 1]
MQKPKLSDLVVSALVDNEDFGLSKDDIDVFEMGVSVPKYDFSVQWDSREDYWVVQDVISRSVDSLYACNGFQADTRKKLREVTSQLRVLTEKFALLEERLGALECAPGGYIFMEAKNSFEQLSGRTSPE